MDFIQICTEEVEKGPNKGCVAVFPDFKVGRSKDLMIRGRSFYAVWDEEQGLWSTDEYDVQRLVDAELDRYAAEIANTGRSVVVKHLRSFNTNRWAQFRKYMQNVSDNAHQLDQQLTFANSEVKKSDYVSRRLPYPLEEGSIDAWDELVGTLYSVTERAKIEWVLGAIVAGDAKKIQKFLVFYGPAGTGKSTVLNIAQHLFEGYTTTFDAKALGSSNASFATEVFKNNPLVAIQHDGDLSKIEDNTKLNSIVSHEDMPMNEKYKPGYTAKVNAFLLMGTNQPVKISDAKSGLIRRLIDVNPTGVLIPEDRYMMLMQQVDFEKGAIAQHCLNVYKKMGKNYYSNYRPTEMMLQTDVFFNFIEAHFDIFKAQDHVTLKQAYSLYKEFCTDTGIDRGVLPQYKVREELRNYFDDFKDRATVGDEQLRSVYLGFNSNKFKTPTGDEHKPFSLALEETESILDDILADQPAQSFRLDEYGKEIPARKWSNVETTLSMLDTSELHFVKLPENHIVIDFDLTDETGEKSLEANLAAASKWKATYAELSKGGNGVHLHYLYDGDVSRLSNAFSDGIEVKTLLGDASLRRRLSKCNAYPLETIKQGALPLKEKKVLPVKKIQTEKGLRNMIDRNLKKEFHPGTKPSIDFIKQILDEAYDDGVEYDLTDMRSRILTFASMSSNRSMECIKIVQKMRFKGQDVLENQRPIPDEEPLAEPDGKLVFFDVEVYPNLFVICWKVEGSDEVVEMINPSSTQVAELFKMKLVGFNNRRYDNHMLYARHLGYSNAALYKLSQDFINNSPDASFGEAYKLSYADIYDFSSKKQGLKKFQIELGLNHLEMDIPWDQPVPEELWDKVVEYCANDVRSTESVFNARKQDFVARQILADLSGLTPNDTTAKHTARIIFGDDRNPQSKFVYTHLKDQFEGYLYEKGKSTYRNEEVGEGGYVYAEPGAYEDVVLLDVASMHPTSIEELNLFGPYTKNFSALKAARIAIKRKEFDQAREMLGGRLKPYLQETEDAEALSYALKIVINIVYGLTSARFENPFKDFRNKDNIVAKRGALFMIDLKNALWERGLQVVHIKTDSIKIPGANQETIDFVTEFGRKYGYDFEHEATYDRFCLVNDAVYIARSGGKWTAVGAQFQHPYVFKRLFSQEEVTFEDLCEPKSVTQGSMYLNFEHDKPEKLPENMQFIGRTGLFVPVLTGGAELLRVKDDKCYAVTGTKGHLWIEAGSYRKDEHDIDMTYFHKLANDAKKAVEKYVPFEEFVAYSQEKPGL